MLGPEGLSEDHIVGTYDTLPRHLQVLASETSERRLALEWNLMLNAPILLLRSTSC
jgi:hypothetical protein